MRKIAVGLIGLGTVGSGVYRVLQENKEEITRRVGAEIYLKRISDIDIERDRGVAIDRGLLTKDAYDIINDPEIEIVIELIGGREPAREFILAALKAGKHVVTANKALLAVSGDEIFTAAADAGLHLGMEASVAGGIPIIKAIRESLAANQISSVFGIINGTANYILTKMTREHSEFGAVLKEAQELGYAEADPTYDVEGIDAAHKLAVLIMLAFGTKVCFDDIFTEGVSHITPLDLQFAEEFGYRIKLLAISKYDSGRFEARVHPTMLPGHTMLAKVDGVFNAVAVSGNALGTAVFIGRGAGQMPTAGAVAADVVDVAKMLLQGSKPLSPPTGFLAEAIRELPVKPIEELECPYYVRFQALDRPGVLAEISRILGEESISIASVMQKGRETAGAVPIVMLTHEARERNLRQAISAIDELDVTQGKAMVIRIEPNPEEGLA